MNFSVIDSRGEDRSNFTRPIQGPYKTPLQEPVKLPEPEAKEEPPHHKFQMNEIKTEFKSVQIQEQFFEQKIEIPKYLPLERRPKPLQLQRTRFQPRRRETSRLSQETQSPQSQPQTQTQPQTQPQTDIFGLPENKEDNEFVYSIDDE